MWAEKGELLPNDRKEHVILRLHHSPALFQLPIGAAVDSQETHIYVYWEE